MPFALCDKMHADLQGVINQKVIALMDLKEGLMSKFFSLIQIEKKKSYISNVCNRRIKSGYLELQILVDNNLVYLNQEK